MAKKKVRRKKKVVRKKTPSARSRRSSSESGHEGAAKRLDQFAKRVATAADQGEDPSLKIPTRALSNVAFNKRSRIIEMGDFVIEVLHLGPAHGPGDAQVWLPEQSLVIAGDMAFHQRMLPIFEDTIAADWITTWDEGFEALEATYVIPGHGTPTNMDQVRRYTRDYLVYLREQIGAHLDDDGGTNRGAVYVFSLSPEDLSVLGWNKVSSTSGGLPSGTLVNSDKIGHGGEWLSDSLIAVGVHGHNSHSGRMLVLRLTDSYIVESVVQTFAPPGLNPNDWFGHDIVAVGQTE